MALHLELKEKGVNLRACFLLAFLPMQVMVTNVTSLLKTVKAVEDEATRGTRALEATIEYMKQELTVRSQVSPPFGHLCSTADRQASMRLSA